MNREVSRNSMLSVIIPVFNEEPNLPELHRRLAAVAERIPMTCEYVFVDDGSQDGSRRVLGELRQRNPSVKILALSRNFGHEIASTCGLDHAEGDAVVLIDADLQDPPELIEQMVAKWREGYDVVFAQRRHREGESWLKKLTSRWFYRLMQLLSDVDIPADTGDFRLMDRRVVHAVRQCRENPRFLRGLVSWVGYRQTAIPYDRDPRFAGQTKYNFLNLLRLSFEAISGFSLVPLRLAIMIGSLVTLFSLVYMTVIIVQRFLFTVVMPYQGYALLACAIFFLGGVQLVMLGVVGYYVGLIFRNSQGRPLYLISSREGWSSGIP